MGCCASKKQLSPLKSGTLLFAAQSMRRTPKSNHTVNPKVWKKAMLKEEIDRMASDPNTSEDYRMIFAPPFSEYSKLTKYLYLSGIGGLTQENLSSIGITLIINATYEWPNVEPQGVQCIKVPVDDGGMKNH